MISPDLIDRTRLGTGFYSIISIRYQKHSVSFLIKKILIIDDELDLCAVLIKALGRENYTVDCAFSLSEVEDKLRDHPQVILLDNNMPDGTGLEYLQMHPVEFMGTTVIMITADVNPLLEMKARQEGVDIFINKPFSVSSLKEVLRQSA